ncbi:MAG: hypothetical protein ABJN69_12960 [Hellea sp.]
MMKLLSNGHFASPQAGSALCAIAVYEVELSQADLVAGETYDLGPLPEKGNLEKLWRFSHATASAYEGIDAGTGSQIDLGTLDDNFLFGFVMRPKNINTDFEYNANSHGAKFDDANLILSIRAATTPEAGKLRIVLWGWAG